jgi:hypothetical protein
MLERIRIRIQHCFADYAAPWPVALASALLVVGIMLALIPLRRGEPWAIVDASHHAGHPIRHAAHQTRDAWSCSTPTRTAATRS